MNGRVYDPLLGRFTSADPFVQFPDSTQGFNRYAYVNNNPLALIDPTGYFSWGHFFKDVAEVAVAVVAAEVIGPYIAGAMGYAAPATASSVVASSAAAGAAASGVAATTTAGFGVVSGITGGFIGGAIVGGNLKSAISGAITGGIFGWVGDFNLDPANNFAPGSAEAIADHAIAGGITSRIQGGSFKDGFISAGFSEYAGPMVGTAFQNEAAKVAAMSIVGGAASSMGGGKFENGAMTSAFAYLFNDTAHNAAEQNNQSNAELIEREKYYNFFDKLSTYSNDAAGIARFFPEVGWGPAVAFAGISAASEGIAQWYKPDVGKVIGGAEIDGAAGLLKDKAGVPIDIIMQHLVP